jgi:hypothetical protein
MAVTGLDVEHRAVVLGGQPFGSAGAHDKLTATLRFAVDPALPIHRGPARRGSVVS